MNRATRRKQKQSRDDAIFGLRQALAWMQSKLIADEARLDRIENTLYEKHTESGTVIPEPNVTE